MKKLNARARSLFSRHTIGVTEEDLSMELIFSRGQYDLPTAITFLMAGLGIGSLVAMLLAPSPKRRNMIRAVSGSKASLR